MESCRSPLTMADSPELLTEQLRHINTLYTARLDALNARLESDREMYQHRISQLEDQIRDHENRIRTATEGVTQFKLFSGLASGGSSVMSLIALLKTLLNF